MMLRYLAVAGWAPNLVNNSPRTKPRFVDGTGAILHHAPTVRMLRHRIHLAGEYLGNWNPALLFIGSALVCHLSIALGEPPLLVSVLRYGRLQSALSERLRRFGAGYRAGLCSGKTEVPGDSPGEALGALSVGYGAEQ